ncbi:MULTISPECIES: hypothetical protein [unclassified Okeania]|uniref:hypothetical protein n=1 Tax=unclassified Okeania TaxID=2634635 RepID=UPI0013BE670B|nr:MULTISPECIES: hypothetical protein [unclassified Okeania]NET18954.1 hypothetical protein [Okeania sp. SIO1H5]NET94406.1 hypothetical protein [Okeania sp. SIO1H2]
MSSPYSIFSWPDTKLYQIRLNTYHIVESRGPTPRPSPSQEGSRGDLDRHLQ